MLTMPDIWIFVISSSCIRLETICPKLSFEHLSLSIRRISSLGSSKKKLFCRVIFVQVLSCWILFMIFWDLCMIVLPSNSFRTWKRISLKILKSSTYPLLSKYGELAESSMLNECEDIRVSFGLMIRV